MIRSWQKKGPVTPPGETNSAGSQVPAAVPQAQSRPASWPRGNLGDWSDRWTVVGVSIFLAAIIWAVFGQTVHFGFVNYDDRLYVYDNPEVVLGLTWRGIAWAFTHLYASNWHPLTWISHMLDCQFYGLNPGGHHLTNVLLHTLVVILLFLVLRQMTGFLWRSAFVAAVFAIHPLRVESVAWIAERKDVLSGVFFMLTLWAYARYVQRRSEVGAASLHLAAPGRREPGAGAGLGRAYALVLLFFGLGLMCKPMLVTVPLVLLLLDYWPLNRFAAVTGRGNSFPIWRGLILEKLPLLGLSVASCVITLFAQAGAMGSFRNFPLTLRMGNALISYVAYLGQMFWPSDLAVLYPFIPDDVGIAKVTLSLVLLAGMSAVVFVLRRQRPYLLTGWLWYLIMLVPVIGIVQVGQQARADRYTYLPQIGLYLVLTWAAADFTARLRYRQWVLASLSAVVVAALLCCARTQVSYWRNSAALWTHTLACTTNNPVAHVDFGLALCQKGNVEEGIAQYQKALQIDPDYAEAHVSLGNALFQRGDADGAVAQYRLALRINPDYADPYNDLGYVLCQEGNVDEAMVQYQKALRINPNIAQIHNNLGDALAQKGGVEAAIAQYRQALRINPDYTEARNNLGLALCRMGRLDEAIVQFHKALQIHPDIAQLHDNLGVALAREGDLDEAIAQFQKALQLHPDYAQARNDLGNAMLISGNVAEAIAQYRQALQLNPRSVATLNNLAWLLATCPQTSLRNGNEAVELAQRANQLTGDGSAAILGTLAAAYAEAGRYPEAVRTAQHALQVAEMHSATTRAEALRSQLRLYQAGKPFRDTGRTP